MTFGDFKVLAMGMKAVYTSDNFLPSPESLKVWYKLLADIPYEVLNVAIQKHMSIEKFPPTIADLRRIATDTMSGSEKDWGQAWEQVRTAIHKYGQYNPEEALRSMDEDVRECVKRMGWTDLCRSENQSVDRANFRMMYEQISHKRHEEKRLPPGVKNHIDQLFGTETKLLKEKTYE